MSTVTTARPATRAAAVDAGVRLQSRTGSYVDSDRYEGPAARVGSYVDSDRYQGPAGRPGRYVTIRT